jgi:hypothetical protein
MLPQTRFQEWETQRSAQYICTDDIAHIRRQLEDNASTIFVSNPANHRLEYLCYPDPETTCGIDATDDTFNETKLMYPVAPTKENLTSTTELLNVVGVRSTGFQIYQAGTNLSSPTRPALAIGSC